MDPEESNQRKEEDKKAHQSGVDRANDLINKARQLRNYKRGLSGAQKSLQAARAGMTAAQAAAAAQGGVAAGTGAAATSPAWGTALAIILLIILIIVLFIIVFRGGQNVNAGTPPDCATVGGTCGTTCQSPNILDTSGASCSASLTGETQVCCVPPPSNTECGALGRTTDGVVCWAKQIYDVLQPALRCTKPTYNRLQTIITNGSYSTTKKIGDCNQGGTYGYLCTDLVIDSNNLAGIINNLSRAVGFMIYQWSSVNGLVLQNSNNVQNVRPGDAVFWFSDMPPRRTQGYHTDVVYKKDISASGYGYLYTLDSNVIGAKLLKHSVVDWKIGFSAWQVGSFGYVWFGLHN